MTNQNERKLSNFWIGFSVGMAGATGLALLLGTKQGRDTLKKLLKFSENIEGNLEELLDRLNKPKGKKDSKKSPFGLEDIEEVLTKIKQVTNHY